MTAAQLNTALAAATCAECNVTVIGTHHDFAVLPNGHLIVIAGTQQVVSGVTVTGDIIIDLGDMENVGGNNPTHTPQPVWAWNEFNHLDINRQPYSVSRTGPTPTPSSIHPATATSSSPSVTRIGS